MPANVCAPHRHAAWPDAISRPRPRLFLQHLQGQPTVLARLEERLPQPPSCRPNCLLTAGFPLIFCEIICAGRGHGAGQTGLEICAVPKLQPQSTRWWKCHILGCYRFIVFWNCSMQDQATVPACRNWPMLKPQTPVRSMQSEARCRPGCEEGLRSCTAPTPLRPKCRSVSSNLICSDAGRSYGAGQAAGGVGHQPLPAAGRRQYPQNTRCAHVSLWPMNAPTDSCIDALTQSTRVRLEGID